MRNSGTYSDIHDLIEEKERQIEYLKSIYDSLPCLVLRFLRTKDGYTLLSYNNLLISLTGTSDEEIGKMSWKQGFWASIPDPEREKLAQSLSSLRKEGDTSVCEYTVITGTGRELHVKSLNSFIESKAEGDVIQRLAFDISEYAEKEKILRKIIDTDPLTGLFNRNRLLKAEKEKYSKLSIACFDIDNLKDVNDLQGHNAGDDVLVRVAFCLKERFPESSYRTGGDEFLISDCICDERTFRNQVEEIRTSLAREGISISSGISIRESDADFKEQYIQADSEMYRCKMASRQGR